MAPLEPRRSAIRRRDFIGLIGSVATTGPSTLLAQPAGPLRLVGVLMGFGEGDRQSRALIAEFRAALANLGWKEGSNLRTELRWGAGDVARIADFAKELVALKPDALLGQTTPVAVSLARETKSIPIIFVTVSDPIGSGLAASLAHPGGNVTGLTFFQPELNAKRLELLKEAMPDLMDVGVLLNPSNQMNEPVLPEVARVSESLKLRLHQFDARAPGDFDGAFAAMNAKGVRAFVVFDDAMLIGNAKMLADLALKHGLASCGFLDYAGSGGLIAYGVDFPDMFRRSAAYVDKILKGAKPSELPVEQATRFATILNMVTAKGLGLTIPSSLLLRADQVIE